MIGGNIQRLKSHFLIYHFNPGIQKPIVYRVITHHTNGETRNSCTP